MSIGSFGGRWWIRTTEVIDDRFTVCPLWPLGKPSIFNYQLDWSWWTDLNPRPADYNQLLYQLSYTSVLSSRLSQRLIYNSMRSANCQQLFCKVIENNCKNPVHRYYLCIAIKKRADTPIHPCVRIKRTHFAPAPCKALCRRRWTAGYYASRCAAAP